MHVPMGDGFEDSELVSYPRIIDAARMRKVYGGNISYVHVIGS